MRVQERKNTISSGWEKEGKYLTFSLGRGEHGICIHRVREIIGMLQITSVPQTEEYVKEVVNLRGRIIPVEARSRLGDLGA